MGMAQEINSLVTWAFQCVVGLAITVGVSHLKKISESINELNKHVAVLLERTERNEKDIDRHEKLFDEIKSVLKRS